jgi:hypothetical protein
MRSRPVLALLAVAALGGCGNAKFGTDSTEILGPGAPLGDVLAKHGAPSSVRVIDSSNILVDYPIEEVRACLGAYVREKGSSISYSARRGKDGGSWVVTNGGWVAGDDSASALGTRGDAPLLQVRSEMGVLVLVSVLGPLLLGFSIAERRLRGAKRATIAAALLLLAANGRHRCGTDVTTLVAAGSPAGAITANHGAPSEVFTLPGDSGAILCWWHHEGSSSVVWGSDKLMSIAYLVQNGKVVNGGYVFDGEAQYFGFPFYELERGHRSFDVGALGWILVLAGASFTIGSYVGRFARGAPPGAPPLATPVDAPKLQAEP